MVPLLQQIAPHRVMGPVLAAMHSRHTNPAGMQSGTKQTPGSCVDVGALCGVRLLNHLLTWRVEA